MASDQETLVPEATLEDGAKRRAAEESPRTAKPAARTWRLFVLGLLAMIVLSAGIQGPDWRTGIWTMASNGYPRLLGIWSPASIILLWIAGVPLYCLGWALLAGSSVRKLCFAALVFWTFLMIPLAAGYVYLRTRPEMLPNLAQFYYPYLGSHLYPHGNRHIIEDPELVVRHRPNWTMQSTLDFGNYGDLIWMRFAPPPKGSIPNQKYTSMRRFNAWGYPAEFGQTEEPNPEVVILGDSFSVGYSVPADLIWPARLLEKLQAQGIVGTGSERDPNRLGTIFAVGGYYPGTALRALKRYIPRARPKIVIALFYEGNDVNDAEGMYHFRQGGGILPTVPFRRAIEFIPLTWIESNPYNVALSVLFSQTDLRFDAETRRRQYLLSVRDPHTRIYADDPLIAGSPAEVTTGKAPYDFSFEPLKVQLGEENWPLVFVHHELEGLLRTATGWPNGSKGWESIQKTLAELADYRRLTGARIFVALAPTKFRTHWPHLAKGELEQPRIFNVMWPMLSSEILNRVRREGWGPIVEENSEVLAGLFAQEAAKRQLPFLDLAPGLRKAAREREDLLFFPYDNHWGPAGYEAAAELLVDKIAAESGGD